MMLSMGMNGECVAVSLNLQTRIIATYSHRSETSEFPNKKSRTTNNMPRPQVVRSRLTYYNCGTPSSLFVITLLLRAGAAF